MQQISPATMLEDIHPTSAPRQEREPGRTGTGLAENPSELHIARLIRRMNAGSGAIEIEDALDFDNPDFDVSYGDYLLHVDFQQRPGAYCLMRNYAGQEAKIPTMMLQKIPSPWALRSDILTAHGTPLDMAFLAMESSDDQAVEAIDKKTWQDMECVHVSKSGKTYKSFLLSTETDELVIVDVERNFATLRKTDLDYIAPRFILDRPFKRPWNILVDETKILPKEMRYRRGQVRPDLKETFMANGVEFTVIQLSEEEARGDVSRRNNRGRRGTILDTSKFGPRR